MFLASPITLSVSSNRAKTTPMVSRPFGYFFNCAAHNSTALENYKNFVILGNDERAN